MKSNLVGNQILNYQIIYLSKLHSQVQFLLKTKKYRYYEKCTQNNRTARIWGVRSNR